MQQPQQHKVLDTQINYRIDIDPQTSNVVMKFGAQIVGLSLTPDQAHNLGRSLIRIAKNARKKARTIDVELKD